jgi:hypothetical protein
MERYKNGKIYKIVDNTNGNVYIGSTCEPTLAHRLAKHRGHYREYLKGGNRYITSFKILENNDYSIVLLEEFPCETKDQLLARERFYIENNGCINKKIPTRTQKEWREDNKNYQKEYKEQNKDKIKNYLKEYREQNKDKITNQKKEWRDDNKDKIKKYREQNKDKITNQKKEYREQNKEYINKKFSCECGGCYTNVNKAKHLKSIKHQNYLNDKNKLTSNDILNAEPL